MGDVAKQALAALAAARSGPSEVWISLFDDAAVAAAAAAVETRLEAGENPPLAGLTVAVKDNIDVAGLATTAGCPAYAYRPAVAAPAVEALVDAGAVVIGKTNLDQFATGLVGTRSPYGIVRNAVDGRYIAGGSSSGSAVAVALGQVDLALATDTAGSGRVPAALNGIVGYKPTQAFISRSGVVPASPSFDCVSLLTNTVATARLAVEVILGHRLPAAGARRRIGVPAGAQLDLDDERAGLFQAAVARLAAGGAELHDVDLTDFWEAGRLLYSGALVAERYAAVGDFAAAHPDDVDAVVAGILAEAAAVPAHELVRDRARLADVELRVAEVFSRVDALVVPTVARHPTVEEVLDDPTGPNHRLGLYNHFCNPLNLAAVTVPAGRTAAGLPFGVNLYSPAGSDAALLDLAARFTGESTDTGEDRESREPSATLVAVAGAHLRGQPLNHQLVDLGARFVEQTTTAAHYRFYALPTTPPKPGLVHVGEAGARVEVELWSMEGGDLARLVSATPWPMALGAVELVDGRRVVGFVCQAGSLTDAVDITAFGGWRAYLASTGPAARPSPTG
ncbi:MAG: allophanate hydrolase [Acidobacteriota bacterium]|nr:allophanate hydrolase [Acidobacteriota bacterium]